MKYKLIKEVKYKEDIYRLRLKQTIYEGLSMWFENNDGNYLFETFRDKDNLNDLLKDWYEILNNKEVEIFTNMDKIELNKWYYRDNENEIDPVTLFFAYDECETYVHGHTYFGFGKTDEMSFEKPYFLEDFYKCDRIEFIEDKIVIHSQTELIIFNNIRDVNILNK